MGNANSIAFNLWRSERLKDSGLPGDDVDIDTKNTSLRIEEYKGCFVGLDLTAEDLSGQNLEGKDFTFVTAGGAKFNGTNLKMANLSEGFFEITDFSGANLSWICAKKAFFANAKLRGTVFDVLENVDFFACHMEGAVITGVLKNVDFSWAILRGAKFCCSFENVCFGEAKLTGVDFTGSSGCICELEYAETDGMIGHEDLTTDGVFDKSYKE